MASGESLIDREQSGGTSGEKDSARREELSGQNQQMVGQGERNDRGSWRDGGDKAEIAESGGMQNRSVDTGQHVKKENERLKTAEQRRGENEGERRADAASGEDDKVFT